MSFVTLGRRCFTQSMKSLCRRLSNRAILSYSANQGTNLQLVGQTLQERLDSIALSKPNEIVYKFCATQTSFTNLELKHKVDELAQSLMQLDLKKGDRVALMLPNVPELVVSLYAIAQIGCKYCSRVFTYFD